MVKDITFEVKSYITQSLSYHVSNTELLNNNDMAQIPYPLASTLTVQQLVDSICVVAYS
jgi:hypothetical protein